MKNWGTEPDGELYLNRLSVFVSYGREKQEVVLWYTDGPWIVSESWVEVGVLCL